MPRLLCLWALTRQAHKELQNFCVPELEAALDILQVTPSQIQAWQCTDWDKLDVKVEGSGKSDSTALVGFHSDCQPCEVQGGILPCHYTNAEVAPKIEVNGGPNGSKFLICTAWFEDETTALRALQRCGLLTAIIEVLGVDEIPTDSTGSPYALTSNMIHGRRIFDLRTGSIGSRRAGLNSTASAQQPGTGAVHGEAAICSCMLLLDYINITGRLVAAKTKQQLGQAAATSGATKSPTCMRPEAACATASLARVGKGSVVLDPCAGSCSLLHAARAAGASCALACDVTAAFFPPASLSEGQRVDCAVADMRSSPIRRGTVDAIVTDPPYGHRASFSTCEYNDSTDEQFQGVLQALFCLAGGALREGGFLVTWLPLTLGWLGSIGVGNTVKDALQDWLQATGKCHGLQLRSLIAEERPGTACRAVAVFWKGDDPEGCSTAWPSKAGEAIGAHDLKEPLSMDTGDAVWASSLRDRGYGESRTAKTGLDADIWRAAWMGDTEAIRAYLGAGGCPDAPDGQGRTPLIFAAGYGRAAAAQLLLSAGACAAAGANGTTALHRAAARGHVAIVELLLESNADVTAQDADGCTPLHLACRFGHAATARALIRAAEACGCRPKVVDILDGAGMAPLHSAAQWGHAEAARILLVEGHAQACVLSSPEALTPAHLAARWGHVHILELLASHLHADCSLQPNQAAQPGEAGKQCGTFEDDQGAFKALVKLRSSAGNTVLDEARIWGRQRCCDYLDKL